ncbi:MAG: carbamoyltransferase HypF [Stellaceae bacterium]
MARACGLDGDVRNDAEGVLVRLAGTPPRLDSFRRMLERDPPPLARIDAIQVRRLDLALPSGFVIADSVPGAAHTQVTPDAAICDACAAEIRDPGARRNRYALTNCTHCGPRLSIIRGIPYDRTRTTMAAFPLCVPCAAEYADPANRRFHAEPTACPDCGPVVVLHGAGGAAAQDDAIAGAIGMLRAGEIVAVKGLGGYQLCCDATNEAAVERLRVGKQREGKPFALMAGDLAVIQRYCLVSDEAARLLRSPQAPIVLLPVAGEPLPDAIAPGLGTLGFMLPTTPLHVLLLDGFDTPLVMTSGNLSDSPQIVDDAEAMQTLSAVASHFLSHDRAIANRVDDSVVRFMAGKPRLLRRARGYAPAPLALPAGFENTLDVLALGGELKATFCLVKDGQAILSQHQGDLEHPATFDDYRRNLSLYAALFDHRPGAVAIDNHPDYLSSKLGRTMAAPIIEVRHHHAHIASCLAENGYPLAAPLVIGIALDGIGWGDDGTFWGGEFLLANYRGFRRIAALAPVALPGGAQAMREPWRNLYAQIAESFGWDAARSAYSDLDPVRRLAEKPLPTLDAMIAGGINAPRASSCGRLFDAVAAALGLCFDRQAYEGEAAARLEALAVTAPAAEPGYSLALRQAKGGGPQWLDAAPLWPALFADLAACVPPASIARRFHNGVAEAVADTAHALAAAHGAYTIALSGGCFQNRLLLERVIERLRASGLAVLSHAQVPTNDGGIALGQAAIAAAQLIGRKAPCV